MTIYEFATNVWENCIDPDKLVKNGYTVQEAADDLENFRDSEWDLPDDITPEAFAAAMNEVVEESQEGDENVYWSRMLLDENAY